MPTVEELERQIVETEAQAEGLHEALIESRVSDLTELVTKGGKLKGHLKGLSPAQFKKVIGREALPSTLMKAKGETQRKIPYELSIDQMMSERGYKDIEDFKDAIEKAHTDKAVIERLWKDRDILINDLHDELAKIPELQSRQFKIIRECPIFKDNKCDALVTQLNGTEVTERRQHPFWRVDIDRDSDGNPEHSFRIRYAKDAHKLVKVTKNQLLDELEEERKPTKVKRRIPKLRVKRHRSTSKPRTTMQGLR